MDKVVIVEYNLQWPVLFTQEAATISNALDDTLVKRIEHFGSTAVPGLAAKPIVDLLVEVRSLTEAQESVIQPLAALGYAYWSDNPDPERMFFVKGLPPNGPRTHHIHMVEADSVLWERLTFRDYLRSHPAEAEQYLQLKSQLAAQFSTDREAYTAGKTAFIQSMTQIAKQWKASSMTVDA
ncbi:hypothetical protein C1752_06385 [Acaryochloris thomasi RCC1774]|uniref:Dephospho-CoA kinase n=1 Tax=Acaryochloris thomasi RCC1774 TaxID=1764569 RepID=A0A2W1JCA4_9CYAN|nr:GrpB family protein [Acaryochloris thomasi]PZD71466.1 hypothetical protein C1752_06385 [Acaryochloris thomasi RCC1774]